jgi:hypothetical protein
MPKHEKAAESSMREPTRIFAIAAREDSAEQLKASKNGQSKQSK